MDFYKIKRQKTHSSIEYMDLYVVDYGMELSWRVGIRMYFLNAFECHFPTVCIWSSKNPNEAAVLAAPILNYVCESFGNLSYRKKEHFLAAV